MLLESGFRLGPYQVVAPLGAGGMGEVYRARDTKLDRNVAIKVLPESFALDADRVARFTREAKTLAALNHPNIAAIYGFEDSGPTHALVMELVEGEDLSQRIARGAIPLADAVPIARQIAGALEAAHEQGIIHRDLKPANIKVRGDGTVKILDFGLAKALGAEGSAAAALGAMNSPTLTAHATEMGVILGTAAYMSPEQARGKPVDPRADIWAFGAVLYEMLTGQRLFVGETASDMMAAVLRDRIDWNGIPAATPDSVRRLLARCLDRDLTQRLQAMGEARALLQEAAVAPPVADPAPGRLGRAGMARQWGLAGVVLVIAATAAGGWIAWRSAGRSGVSAVTQGTRSIAVLPFVNSSGNADDEYLADGMTDELISSLGKVPGLRVAARSSAFSFKGQKTEIREVARKLSVESVLEGTVRRSGKRLRVTVSLVSAADGLQIWTSSFESDGSDPFAIQDEVTQGVVSGLSLQLVGAALAANQAGRTRNPEAHDLYLRGLQAAQNAASEADLRRAIDFYQQALARDREFALPYAGIAAVHMFLADAYVAPNEAYPKARAAAEAALERDSQLAEAHAAKAFVAFSIDWDWVTADREFSRALELNPNSVDTLLFLGTYRCFSGHPQEGLADLDRAARLDPLSPLGAFFQEFCSYASGRYESVIELHRKTQAIAPTFVYIDSWVGGAYRELGDYQAALREYAAADKLLNGAPQYGLALTYLKVGREKDAREVMRRLDERARTHYVPYFLRAIVHAGLGDMDEAVALLQRAVDTREVIVHAFRRLPEMAALRNEPRAQTIFEQADAIRKIK